jgi:hypothetical protein
MVQEKLKREPYSHQICDLFTTKSLLPQKRTLLAPNLRDANHRVAVHH